MVLDPIPQSLPIHFLGSRPQPPTPPRIVPHPFLGISVSDFRKFKCTTHKKFRECVVSHTLLECVGYHTLLECVRNAMRIVVVVILNYATLLVVFILYYSTLVVVFVVNYATLVVVVILNYVTLNTARMK